MIDRSFFIFRNSTIEPLFGHLTNVRFSDYDSLEIKGTADIYIWFYTLPFDADNIGLIDKIDLYTEKVNTLIQNLNFAHTGLFICFSISKRFSTNFPSSYELAKKINDYNDTLYQLSRTHNNVKFVDIDQFTNNFAYDELVDMRYYFNGLLTYSPKLAKPFDRFFTQQLNAIFGVRKKCLVLDLDNVLWGRILGEDGLNKIDLGESYPGNAFKLFQEYIGQIQKQGIILTICSKNNLNDVLEVWEKHPDMVLKKDDFASVKINWDDKAKNIMEIASELNIGLDSLVFIDDNPRERELVKSLLPEVTVPEFPTKPYLLLDFIKKVYTGYFQVYSLTEEDKSKTQQYFHNAKRKDLKLKSLELSDYIRKLEIAIKFENADEMNIARIAQMTQKTNQFNLTTLRFTETEIERSINQGEMVSCARVSDKFGDSGITIASIINIDQTKKEADIKLLLLSCRILGNGIENEYLKIILNDLFKKGVKTVYATFIPTNKNKQTKMFYDGFGFSVIKENKGIKKYKLLLEQSFNFDPKYKILV
jgi:FkbH-like protein